jgi:hypothetical protein
VWCIFDQQHRSGIHHCRKIDRPPPFDQHPLHLKFSCTPRAYVIILRHHHPTSSSYVIPYVIIRPLLTESNLYVQGRDEKLITIGNKPVFPQSLIPTCERQVPIPQASVGPVDSFDLINSIQFDSTRFFFQVIDLDL